MSDQSSNQCFVLLPTTDLHYGRLFEEVFAPAIANAGLSPYLLQQNPTDPIALETLTQEIVKADAVFIDLSQNDSIVWFAIGCAFAFCKPLCLVSSTVESNYPFDTQALDIIPYPAVAYPSDYIELEESITFQLAAKLPKVNEVQSSPEQPIKISEASEIKLPTPTIQPIANSFSSNDLTAHETLALTIIDLKASDRGLSPRDLGLEMKASDSAKLTSHAMNSLRRRKLIERRPVLISEGNESYIAENLFITRAGENWLLRHGKRKIPQQTPPVPDLFMASR